MSDQPKDGGPALYDKTGREIMVGDVLKIFHFVGARRKRYFIYKQVLGAETTAQGRSIFRISHLTVPPDTPQSYVEYRDHRILHDYEIVQGFDLEHGDFRERPQYTDAVLAERAKREGV